MDHNPNASSSTRLHRPSAGGSLISYTVFRCKHEHPVQPGVRHGAHCGAQGGVWEWTGVVFTEANSAINPRRLEPSDERTHLAYCPTCKAVSEYRLVEEKSSAA